MSGITAKLSRVLALPPNQLKIIGVALCISMALLSGQRFINTGLQATLLEKSAELLTADMEVASTHPLTDAQLTTIDNALPNHASSQRQLFTSMMQFYGHQTQLVEVLAVDAQYPLRGNCLAQDTNGNITAIADLLHATSNAVVVAKSLAQNTDITFGSTVVLGEFKGTVVGVIHHEPDISIQSLKMGPRVYMALNDVEKTGFNPQLSRTYYSRFFRFKSPPIARSWTPTIGQALGIEGNQKSIRGSYGPSQPIVVRNYSDINNDIVRGFSSMRQFFLLLSVFMMLLTGVAFGFIIWASVVQRLNAIGDLLMLGVPLRRIHGSFMRQSIQLAVIGTAAGLVLGGALAQLLHSIICKSLNVPVTLIHFSLTDVAFMAFFAIGIMLIKTKAVLRLTQFKGLVKHNQPSKTSAISLMLMGVALLAFLGIFLWLNQLSPTQIAGFMFGFSVLFFILGFLDALLFYGVAKLPTGRLSLPARLAIKYLSRGHTIRRMAFISICFSLVAILSISHYQASLTHELNPKKSNQVLPSLFLMDLYNYQLPEFESLVHVRHESAPLLRTRINRINSQHLSIYKTNRNLSNDYFLHREQNLSSRGTLYPTETITQGQWFNSTDKTMEISIESQFAKRLGIELGDTIEFMVMGMPFEGTVTSFRRVDWTTLNPNFFMLIEPPYLDPLPLTWVSAIYSQTPNQTQQLQQELTQAFPNVSIIDIQSTSQKVMGFLSSFILAIQCGALFCLCIGGLLFILLGKLVADIRKNSVAMLHWVGLSKRQIARISLIENLWFSGITMLSAVGISVALCKVLFTSYVPLALVINWWVVGLMTIVLHAAVVAHWAVFNRGDTNV
jgi:putative ABC transport system permease protein